MGYYWNIYGILMEYIYIWIIWYINPIGSMDATKMVTWIPSIDPIYVSIYTSTMDPMGMGYYWNIYGILMGYIWTINGILLAGWWLSPTPLKNDGVKVSWGDDIPTEWKNKKMFQTTNQHRFHFECKNDNVITDFNSS